MLLWSLSYVAFSYIINLLLLHNTSNGKKFSMFSSMGLSTLMILKSINIICSITECTLYKQWHEVGGTSDILGLSPDVGYRLLTMS